MITVAPGLAGRVSEGIRPGSATTSSREDGTLLVQCGDGPLRVLGTEPVR